MNFILRNLGWILLFLFFVFMLFIISTNQKDISKDVKNVSSGEISQTGVSDIAESVENLNKLVEKIEKEEKNVSKEGEITEMKAEDIKIEQEKKSFFDIFKRKNKKEDTLEKQETQTGKVVVDENVVIEEEKNVARENFVTQEKTMDHGMNLSKNTGDSTALEISGPSGSVVTSSYGDSLLSGKELITSPGKEFQVGVHSLKLNNKSFTEKIGYILKGDRVKQITSENTRGCFEVEVLSSLVLESIGKKAYVCKKYLVEVQEKNETNSVSVSENIETKPEMSVVKNYFHVNNTLLLQTQTGENTNMGVAVSDILLQISPISTEDCFKIRIVGSNILSQHGKEGYVCKNTVSSHTIKE